MVEVEGIVTTWSNKGAAGNKSGTAFGLVTTGRFEPPTYVDLTNTGGVHLSVGMRVALRGMTNNPDLVPSRRCKSTLRS